MPDRPTDRARIDEFSRAVGAVEEYARVLVAAVRAVVADRVSADARAIAEATMAALVQAADCAWQQAYPDDGDLITPLQRRHLLTVRLTAATGPDWHQARWTALERDTDADIAIAAPLADADAVIEAVIRTAPNPADASDCLRAVLGVAALGIGLPYPGTAVVLLSPELIKDSARAVGVFYTPGHLDAAMKHTG